MIDDLITWLRAQIDDDERGANAALAGQADPENGWTASRTPGLPGVGIAPHVGHIHEDVQAAHVVRWNPARVLREVEAKRRIVRECENQAAWESTTGRKYPATTAWALAVTTLRVLALPYVDRPGYQEGWKP